MKSFEQIAKAMYEAYAAAMLRNIDFPLPTWAGIGQVQRDCWVCAARVQCNEISEGALMTERPILAKAPMVRAILSGDKRHTRRHVKHVDFGPSKTPGYDWCFRDKNGLWQDQTTAQMMARCPYGQVGDRLWVRETFQPFWIDADADSPRNYKTGEGYYIRYIATEEPHPYWNGDKDGDEEDNLSYRLKPSIFMPRWASRITLEITGVRIERLHDIRREDAVAEGVAHMAKNNDSTKHPDGRNVIIPSNFPEQNFQRLWEAVNGMGSWECNPWVWVVEFKRV